MQPILISRSCVTVQRLILLCLSKKRCQPSQSPKELICRLILRDLVNIIKVYLNEPHSALILVLTWFQLLKVLVLSQASIYSGLGCTLVSCLGFRWSWLQQGSHWQRLGEAFYCLGLKHSLVLLKTPNPLRPWVTKKRERGGGKVQTLTLY